MHKEFKKLRNEVNTAIRKAKDPYYRHKFENIDQQHKFWKAFNELNNAQSSTTPTEINVNGVTLSGTQLSDKFNEHFLSCGLTQRSARKRDPVTYINSLVQGSIFLRPSDELEVQNIIGSLSNNSAAGPDEIKAGPIKAVASIIATPFSHVCNCILRDGLFPDELKVARVTVLHKGGPKDDLNNYRPISILSVFSKIIERVIFTRINQYLKNLKVIVPQQFGFQKKKSTELALLGVKEKLIENIEKKLYTVGLFLDIRKAFDSVKHDILLNKIGLYGIRGVAQKLIKSYLTDRKQFVLLGATSSAFRSITVGVPQGSILGPLLFLLYINDIPNIPHTQEVVLYADDTNVFFSGSNLMKLQIDANRWLGELSDWLYANELQLNINKTKYVMFRARNTPRTENFQLCFRNNIIQSTNTIKFLGVTFNEYLSWNEHIDHMKLKLSRIIGALWKVRNQIPARFRTSIYSAMIQSHLQYCILIWGTTTDSNLRALFQLQKRSVRALENLRYTDSVADIGAKYGLIDVFQLHKRKLAMYMYSHIRESREDFEHAYLRRNQFFEFRTSNYKTPKIRTNYGFQSLQYLIPSLLNKNKDLMDIIDQCPTLICFKRALTSFVFSV